MVVSLGKVFAISDIISVQLTRYGRLGTDGRYLYCLVVRKPHPDHHTLLATDCLLDPHYSPTCLSA